MHLYHRAHSHWKIIGKSVKIMMHYASISIDLFTYPHHLERNINGYPEKFTVDLGISLREVRVKLFLLPLTSN